jgi:hypothetical protein
MPLSERPERQLRAEAFGDGGFLRFPGQVLLPDFAVEASQQDN